MRVSNAFVGLDLAELFPDSAIKSKNLGIFIADYHARRDDARAARRQMAVPDSHYAKLLTRFDEILSELTRLRDTSLTDPLSIQVKKVKKLTNRLHKCINELDRVEKETPFGKSAENLVFAISSIVTRELESIAAAQPMNAYDYLTGRCKHFWLTTTTQSLTTGLNRNSLSFEVINASASEKRESKKFQNKVSNFRGQGGLYDQLAASGFLLDKVVDGTKVRLKVNLEWIFGWSINILEDPSVIAEMTDFAPDPRGENAPNAPLGSGAEPFFSGLSRDNITCFSQNNKFKETEYNMKGLASPDLLSPTIVGEKGEESEENETAARENPSLGGENFEKKNSLAREIAAQEDEKTALEVATDSAMRLMKSIFNRNNLKNGKVRNNGTSDPVLEIPKNDALAMKDWMLNTMRAIKRDGENWSDVAKLVNEAIENTAKYLHDRTKRWIYPPKFYLDPNFSTGSLKWYVESFLHHRSAEQPRAASPVNRFTPYIQKFIEEGANREKVGKHVRNLGEDVVTLAIKLANIRIADGFTPMKGRIAYIFGILDNKPLKEVILPQVELAYARYLQKKTAKEAENSAASTAKKVEKIVLRMVQKADLGRFTHSVCQLIAERANAQNANDGQIEIWISGVAKGTSRLFQS